MPDHQDPITRQHDCGTIWLTTTVDRAAGHADHAVRHEELATRSGSYMAVCGSTVYPASMMTPPGPQCIRCVNHLETTAPQHGQPRNALSRRKPSRVRRIPALAVSRWRRNINGNPEA